MRPRERNILLGASYSHAANESSVPGSHRFASVTPWNLIDLSARRDHRIPSHLMRLFLIGSASFVLGCGGGGEETADAGLVDTTPDEVTEFSVVLGLRDSTTGEFMPLTGNEVVPLIIGFQGLMYVDLIARTDAVAPELSDVVSWVRFDDPTQDYQLRENRLAFAPGEGGYRWLPQFRVAFGQDVSLLIGKHVRISSEFTTRGWHGAAQGELSLDPSVTCFEDPDGTVTCNGN